MAANIPKPQSITGDKVARIGSTRLGDWIFKNITLLFTLIIAGLVVLIIVQMAHNSRDSFAKFGLSFLWNSTWDPVKEEFGSLPFVYGTALSSLLSLLI